MIRLGLVPLVSVFVAIAGAFAFAGEGRRTCEVKITSPAQGSRVGDQGDVSGTAHIPEGTKLWVFVHRRGLGIWWPEGAGAASIDPANHKWDVLAFYGQPRDAGAQFEITAVAVNPAEDQTLATWVERAEQTQTYPGVPLPSPSKDGCISERVTVVKQP